MFRLIFKNYISNLNEAEDLFYWKTQNVNESFLYYALIIYLQTK